MDKQSERQQLTKFLDDLDGVLDWTITNFDSLAPTLTPDAEVRRSLVRAWEDFHSSQVLARVKETILKGDADKVLIDHGLTGPQLAFKLQAFEAHMRRFAAARQSGPPFGTPSRWSRVRDAFRRFFGRSRTTPVGAP